MTDQPDDTNKPERALNFCAVHDQAGAGTMKALTDTLPGWGFVIITIDPTGHSHSASNVDPRYVADVLFDTADAFAGRAEAQAAAEAATAEQAGKELENVLEKFAKRVPDGEAKH